MLQSIFRNIVVVLMVLFCMSMIYVDESDFGGIIEVMMIDGCIF